MGLLRGTTSEKEMLMRRKTVRLVVLLVLVLLTAPFAAHAQPGKVYWIGVLSQGSPASGTSALAARQSFLQRLHDLGWIVGQNLVFEARYAAGQADRLPALAAELVRLKVDLIITFLNDETLAAHQAVTPLEQ